MARPLVRTDRYSRVAIAFHWTIAVLVIVNILLGLFHESLLKGLHVMPVHMSIGLTVLVLSIGRWLWRLGHRMPPLPDSMPTWEKISARATHWAFYVLIILMPLSGWIMASGRPRPSIVSWFGLFPVPSLPVSKSFASGAHEFHVIFGFTMAALVVLHVAAALRHQFILRDRVLHRMAPVVDSNG